MLYTWSNRLAEILLNNKIIEEKEKDIHAYGFQIIISSMIGILMVGITLTPFYPVVFYSFLCIYFY